MDERVLEELGGASYVSLATFRRNGRAVETPVWLALHDERFYVFTAGDSGKVKRLRNDPHIRVAACTARGRITGPWSDGTARIVSDAATLEAAYGALRAKYGWQLAITDLLSRLSGRYARRLMLELDLG